MKKISLLFLSFLYFGCTTEGPYVPSQRQPSPEVENTFVMMDQELSGLIAVDMQDAKRTLKGKLRALANMRNRTNQDLTVQVQTIFRDAKGFSIGDDTSWETIVLTANETRTIDTTSTSKKADRFNMRVRMVR